MNKKQKEKVIELRKEGLGYKRISGYIDGVSRDSVRGFIKSKWFEENHPELVNLDNYKTIDYTKIEKNYGKGICEYCGEEYKKKAGHQKYCKPEHKKLDQRENKYCVECGNLLPKNRHKYCSNKCRDKYNYEYESAAGKKRDCEYCGVEFISYYGKKHCSDECKEKDRTYDPERDLGNRVCRSCGKTFPATIKHFHKHNNAKGGLNYECKKCANKRRRKYKSYKIECDWCGETKNVNRPNQRFCSTDCQHEWQRNSEEFKKIIKENLNASTGEEMIIDFKNKFEDKFPGFKYHSEYTGTDDYFKMECKECGHVQERNAQIARPSREKRLSCDKCELRERVANRILSLKQKIIRKKKHKIKTSEQKEITKKINKEVEAIKQIKKNHRYYKKCLECGKYFFTNRVNIKTCNDNCKRKRKNRIKDLNRRKKLKENGEINYKITINKLLEKNNGICQICGEPVDLSDCYYNENGHFVAGPKYPSIDHIIPVAKGGVHTWNNVQLAHRDCNYNKSDESLFEIKDNKLKISI